MEYLPKPNDIDGTGEETVCGYRVKDLILFARICSHADIAPHELERFARNTGKLASMLGTHMKKAIDDTLLSMKETMFWV